MNHLRRAGVTQEPYGALVERLPIRPVGRVVTIPVVHARLPPPPVAAGQGPEAARDLQPEQRAVGNRGRTPYLAPRENEGIVVLGPPHPIHEPLLIRADVELVSVDGN